MKKSLIYFLTILFFSIFIGNNVSAQSRTSASIDIRIRIVKSLSTSLVQNGVLENADSKIVESFERDQDREVLLHYGNRYEQEKMKKLERKLKSNKLSVFNRYNEKIGSAEIQNSTTLKNISKTDKLQFVPSTFPKEEGYNIEPSITLVY